MKKIKNNDHRLSCRISHFSNYYQPSKLLAGGSNPPGRAMELSGGYMHARVYPPFFIPHNRSGHSPVADFQTLLLGQRSSHADGRNEENLSGIPLRASWISTFHY